MILESTQVAMSSIHGGFRIIRERLLANCMALLERLAAIC